MLPWNAESLTFDDARFCGVARLFPLPDLVMFPHVMQPLHIFERRYREMLNQALDSDGLIAMSVLAPGWESDYDGRPPVLSHVCLGKVVSHHRLDDGRYNILLLGVRRARIGRELPVGRSFREVELELVDDVYSLDGEETRAAMQLELSQRFQQALPRSQGVPPDAAVTGLLSVDMPLGVLTDVVSFALPLPPALKSEMLAECSVDRRARMLLRALGAQVESPAATLSTRSRGFTPRFSVN